MLYIYYLYKSLFQKYPQNLRCGTMRSGTSLWYNTDYSIKFYIFMSNINIGDTIKQFRKRKGLSQLDLEMKIDSAQGTISRIENGQVNPSKETLLRIIEALDLRGYDAATLFGININDFVHIIDISKKLNDTLDLDDVLQKAVNDICYELDLIGSSLLLVEGNKLYSKTVTQSGLVKLGLKIIGKPLKTLSASLVKDTNNLLIKSVNNRQFYIGYKMTDFLIPQVSVRICHLLEKISGFKVGVVFPLIISGNVLGCIFFGTNKSLDINRELPVLKAFTDHIAVAIHNAQKYEDLQREIEKLRNEVKIYEGK
jgi:transcriptional regulator with XRE-family HTH domain